MDNPGCEVSKPSKDDDGFNNCNSNKNSDNDNNNNNSNDNNNNNNNNDDSFGAIDKDDDDNLDFSSHDEQEEEPSSAQHSSADSGIDGLIPLPSSADVNRDDPPQQSSIINPGPTSPMERLTIGEQQESAIIDPNLSPSPIELQAINQQQLQHPNGITEPASVDSSAMNGHPPPPDEAGMPIDNESPSVSAQSNDNNHHHCDYNNSHQSGGALEASDHQQPSLLLNGKSESVNSLKSLAKAKTDYYNSLFASPVSKEFTFVSSDGEAIFAAESMAECKIGVAIPTSYVALAVQRSEIRLSQLSKMYYLKPSELRRRDDLMAMLTENLHFYREANNAMDKCTVWYKPSSMKDDPGMAFVPTNLHLQSFKASVGQEESSNQLWDFFTCGAFISFGQGFRDGGLRVLQARLAQNLQDSTNLEVRSTPVEAYWSSWTELQELMQRLSYLRAQIMKRTSSSKVDSTFLDKMLAELWDILAQLKSFGDRFALNAEVDQLVKSFQSYRKDALDAKHNAESTANSAHNPAEVRFIGSGSDECGTPTTNPRFELDSLDTQYTELEAVMACVLTKVSNLESVNRNCGLQLDSEASVENWVIDLRRTTFIVMTSLEKLGYTMIDAWNYRYLMQLYDARSAELFYRVEQREDIVYSQILGTALAGLAAFLWSIPIDPLAAGYVRTRNILSFMERHGFLITISSYLSCFRDEKGMLEDMVESVQLLQSRTVIKLVKNFSVGSCLPVVEGSPAGFRVNLPVPAEVYESLPASLQHGAAIKLLPLLFSCGINEEQSLASTFGDVTLEHAINAASYAAFQDYANYLTDWIRCQDGGVVKRDEDIIRSGTVPLVRQLLTLLGEQIKRKRMKNVEILHLVSQICRCFDGVQVICCKSGKDRTSMAVTLEEAFCLQQRCDLPQASLPKTLDELRRNGTRRKNVSKNIAGLDKYAFTSLQLHLMPELFRPPAGCYGSKKT